MVDLDELAVVMNEASGIRYGRRLKKTGLAFYSDDDWIQFLKAQELDPHLIGLYSARQMRVHLNKESNLAEVSLIHEYAGHGLFFEYSEHGREIVKLERALQTAEEPAIIGICHQLAGLNMATGWLREGFALLVEHDLSRVRGREEQFEAHLQVMPDEAKGLYLQACDLRQDPAYYDALGFAKTEIFLNSLERLPPLLVSCGHS